MKERFENITKEIKSKVKSIDEFREDEFVIKIDYDEYMLYEDFEKLFKDKREEFIYKIVNNYSNSQNYTIDELKNYNEKQLSNFFDYVIMNDTESDFFVTTGTKEE